MSKTILLDVLEYRVMTRLKQRLDLEVKELALHESSVEDFQNFEGRGKGIKIKSARMVGEISKPELMIDFEWKFENTGLEIKQWTLFVNKIRKNQEFEARALAIVSEIDEARVDWRWVAMPFPDGHGPSIGSDLKLNIGQTEERADWLLSLAIGLGLTPYADRLDGKWEDYYEYYKPKGQEVMHNWVKYPSATVARWAVFLDHLSANFEHDSNANYDLGDGVRYGPNFRVSAWDSLYIDVKGGPPTEEEQDKARRLSKNWKDVLITFGEMNTKGWLFRNGERKAGNFTILDCPRCDRIILNCHEEGSNGVRWSCNFLGTPPWCDNKNCIKPSFPALNRVKNFFKHPKSRGKIESTDQFPGLYDNVKAALMAAKRERFSDHN
jgi:hypothetical protein